MDTVTFATICAAVWIALSGAGLLKLRLDSREECDEYLPGSIDSLEAAVGDSLGHHRP
ncbi:hypothetical protein GCM10025867_49290 (plasmid) [Frondihabitans sucicola]|uniref:Uncharacterized protein n=1 Tax=Frondihabitans sucicola TaxID=1268041 RepID=A0ABM8GW89_9MICO|nr:hypothetical protein [Frondihabitans sucicola]BDZ52688.1 hypothetical protein GCM10025867_49290 [Frondihabitans sucicola]